MQNIVYLDNAATSWPKPKSVTEAMVRFMEDGAANPGRSGHRMSVNAARVIFEARCELAELFGVGDPLRIVFTRNATESLNLALFGLLEEGDHVVTTSMEHNSVIRPLRYLESKGVELTVVRCSEKGELTPGDVERAMKKNTRLVVMLHGSNVTGTIMPVREIGELLREMDVFFCVDAAQTAGAVEIDVEEMCIDLLAFTGHKSLYGPQGTGGLYISERVEPRLTPIVMGGTGSRSEYETQPEFMPDKYESGTPNTVGICGLLEGVRFVKRVGLGAIREKEEALTKKLLDGLSQIKGVTLYGPMDERLPVVSFNIEGFTPSEVAMALDERFGVMCRPGLHCAPLAHRTIGTFPHGTVRFGISYFNSEDDIFYALKAVEEIATKGNREVVYVQNS